MHIKEIAILAIATTILFVTEQLLSFLPNIQLTFLLIILYSRLFKTKKTLVIILIHVVLDNLVNGSFNVLYLPFMLLGYSLVPILLNTVFAKINSSVILAVLAVFFSLVFCWLFIIPNVLIYNVDFLTYFIADIYFEALLALSSFLSVLWLYKPLLSRMENFLCQYLAKYV